MDEWEYIKLIIKDIKDEPKGWITSRQLTLLVPLLSFALLPRIGACTKLSQILSKSLFKQIL